MKFYDIDSVFISGKYAGETLAEVFEKDPKYINYCQENDDDFYVSPEHNFLYIVVFFVFVFLFWCIYRKKKTKILFNMES